MEKLNQSNNASWSYKMHQYLLGHGYWSYVKGENNVAPNATNRDFPTWEQATTKVMYYYHEGFASRYKNKLKYCLECVEK